MCLGFKHSHSRRILCLKIAHSRRRAKNFSRLRSNVASYVHLLSEPDLTEPDIIICSVETSYGVSVHKVLGAFHQRFVGKLYFQKSLLFK